MSLWVIGGKKAGYLEKSFLRRSFPRRRTGWAQMVPGKDLVSSMEETEYKFLQWQRETNLCPSLLCTGHLNRPQQMASGKTPLRQIAWVWWTTRYLSGFCFTQLTSPDHDKSALGEAVSACNVLSALAGVGAKCLADSSVEDKTNWVPIQCPRASVGQGWPISSVRDRNSGSWESYILRHRADV